MPTRQPRGGPKILSQIAASPRVDPADAVYGLSPAVTEKTVAAAIHTRHVSKKLVRSRQGAYSTRSIAKLHAQTMRPETCPNFDVQARLPLNQYDHSQNGSIKLAQLLAGAFDGIPIRITAPTIPAPKDATKIPSIAAVMLS